MSRSRCLLLTALLALPAASVAADWLVLRDGSRVETKAAWRVDGRRVVFHTPEGRLSSLRVDQVDLGASREASREAAAAPSAAAPGETASAAAAGDRPAGRRWTNDDVRRLGAGPPIGPPGAAAARPAGAPVEGEEEAAEGEGAPGPSTVVVRDWDTEVAATGLVVRGVLINPTADRAAIGVRLTVVLFDQEGHRAGEAVARVSPTTILAGASGSFEAHFPDAHAYGAIRFDLSSQPLSQGAPAAEPGEPAGGVAPAAP